ncbi:hypothetical protein T229_02525 [Tannerella sp. oral taxon BU063 isolate Cell 5]|uniref:Uncharacterized protein n=1 Tax=Tannerella sp. oral taxon BU063 isolate Cell 5 TaxID=1410950 RepID=W2CGH0_9BACT|nr:hypothetical protein T229_02525 [Tannerella sp. oral taxon BU063 isolate Cell 5]
MTFGCKNRFCLGTPECFQGAKHMLIRNLRVLLEAKHMLLWNPGVLLGAKHMLIIKSNHLRLNKQILPNKSIRL